MRLFVLALAAALVFLARPARADQTARLVYARGVGAETCPDEESLKLAVAARLGYDPFRPVAALTVIANLSRVGVIYRGEVRLLGEKGDEVGSRSIGAGSERCGDVVSALALSISVAIDPLLLVRPPPPPVPAVVVPDSPPPSPAPDSPPVQPPPAPPAPPASPAPPPELRSEPRAAALPAGVRPAASPRQRFAGATLLGSVGSAPAPALGLAAFAGVRSGRTSVAGEVRVDLPSATNDAGVSSFLLLGSFVPCLHVSVAFGCVVGSAGMLTATSNGLVETSTSRAFYVAGGARIGADLPLAERVSLRTSLDLDVPITRYPFALSSNGTPVYSPSPVSVTLALGASYRF